MPAFFRNAPIQRKLMLIILGSYAAALLMAAAVHSSFRIFSEIGDLDPDVATRFDGAALAVILVISALIAYGVSQRLQTAISLPMRTLAETAKRIARQSSRLRVALISRVSLHACSTPSIPMRWPGVCPMTHRSRNKRRRAKPQRTPPRSFSMITSCEPC